LDWHPNVHLHFTPTYSSWLNQVELWFAKIERDVARGVFNSVHDLRRKPMRYIRHYNKAPKTIKWRYRDPTRRITLDSVVTVHSHVRRYQMQASESVACEQRLFWALPGRAGGAVVEATVDHT
jgi:hypothetical protein